MISIKVQRIIGTLSGMLISNANIIFTRMSITFFRDAGNAIFKCIFLEEDNLCFFDRRVISCLEEKKHHLYRIHRKHISMYFLRKIIFYFPPRKSIIFSRKRNVIFPDGTRKIIFRCDFFLERPSFQNIWKKKIGFLCSKYYLIRIIKL